MLEELLFPLVAIVWLNAFLSMFLSRLLRRRLLERPDPKVPIPPQMFSLDNTPRDSLRFTKALVTRGYAKHGDPMVRKLGTCLFVAFVVQGIALAAFAAILITTSPQ